jgi:hypothetical protein
MSLDIPFYRTCPVIRLHREVDLDVVTPEQDYGEVGEISVARLVQLGLRGWREVE